MIKQLAAGMIAGLLVLAAASTLCAQSKKTPPTARDVLLLVTEEIGVAGEEQRQQSYWWVNPSSPQWTESDKRLREGLTDEGVELLELPGDQRVSKVYRRPSLSLANAASLGAILGAKHVVVGTISYEKRASIEALNLERVAADVDVSLVSAETGETTPLHRFTLHREAFEKDDRTALERARVETTDALVDVLGETLMRGPGPVGVDADETLISLRNAEDAGVLETVTDFLVELDRIDKVGVRWASEGLIALELNPGRHDDRGLVRRAARALAAQAFDEFALIEQRPASAEGLAEFRVSVDPESAAR